MVNRRTWLIAICFAFGVTSILPAQTVSLLADRSQKREGDWFVRNDGQTGIRVYSREMTLHPKAEPKPALKHRFVPDRFDQVEGNSAVYYLKAMSFLEETRAREEITKFERNAQADADANGMSGDETPPSVWYGTAPNELPIPEVKKYLAWHTF